MAAKKQEPVKVLKAVAIPLDVNHDGVVDNKDRSDAAKFLKSDIGKSEPIVMKTDEPKIIISSFSDIYCDRCGGKMIVTGGAMKSKDYHCDVCHRNLTR